MEEKSFWKMIPADINGQVTFQSISENDEGCNISNKISYLSLNEDGKATVDGKATRWELKEALSFPTYDHLIVPKLDYLLGRTVQRLLIHLTI